MSDTNALIKLVPLNHIGCDERLQLRAGGIDEEFVDQLTDVLADGRELDDGQPPVVFWDGHMHWLADGNHRITAHKKAGREAMRCEVRQGGFRAALRCALSANATHGLRRTNADKRRAVDVALADEEWCNLSNRQVAELCGVSTWLVNVARNTEGAETAQAEEDASGERVSHLDDGNASGERLSHLETDKSLPTSGVRTRTGKDGKNYRASRSSCSGNKSNAMSPDPVSATDKCPDKAELPAAAPQVLPPVDAVGQPLPENLIPIFAGLAWVEGVVAELGALIERIEEHSRRPAGRCLNGSKALDHLNDGRLLLRSAVPYRVCPHCGGSGVTGGDCPTCRGLGYLNRAAQPRVA